MAGLRSPAAPPRPVKRLRPPPDRGRAGGAPTLAWPRINDVDHRPDAGSTPTSRTGLKKGEAKVAEAVKGAIGRLPRWTLREPAAGRGASPSTPRRTRAAFRGRGDGPGPAGGWGDTGQGAIPVTHGLVRLRPECPEHSGAARRPRRGDCGSKLEAMASSKPAIPEPTEIAGRYVIDKKLGAGAFGTVYKAKDKILGRMVAIKTIRLEGLAAQARASRRCCSASRARPTSPRSSSTRTSSPSTTSATPTASATWRWSSSTGSGSRRSSPGPAVPGAGGRSGRAGGRRPRLRPQTRRRPPRHQARQHHGGGRRPGEGDRLRHRQGDRVGRPSHHDGQPPGHALLHEPGAGPRREHRRAQRPLLRGLRALRDAGGQEGLPGRDITALIFKIITEEPPPLRELARTCRTRCWPIVEKALAKSPDARYQSGRELADELLAHTRAGTPTLRQSESPTVPSKAASGIPTAMLPLRPSATPPTQATPPTRVAKSPGDAAAPPRPRPRRFPDPPTGGTAVAPRSAAAPRKVGRRSRPLIGIGIAGMLSGRSRGGGLVLLPAQGSGPRRDGGGERRPALLRPRRCSPEPPSSHPEAAPTTLAAAAPPTTLPVAATTVPPRDRAAATLPRVLRPPPPRRAPAARASRPPPAGGRRRGGGNRVPRSGAPAGRRRGSGRACGRGLPQQRRANQRLRRLRAPPARQLSPRRRGPQEAPAISPCAHS